MRACASLAAVMTYVAETGVTCVHWCGREEVLRPLRLTDGRTGAASPASGLLRPDYETTGHHVRSNWPGETRGSKCLPILEGRRHARVGTCAGGDGLTKGVFKRRPL